MYLSHIWPSHVGRQGPLGTCPLLAPVRLLAALLVGCWRTRAKGTRAPKHGMTLTPARHPPPLPRPRQHWVFAGPLTSASGLPCWSVTDAAGGLEDAVACCNPSKLSLSLSAVERVAAMAERPWPPPCGDQSSPCALLVRKLPYVSETKVRRPGL